MITIDGMTIDDYIKRRNALCRLEDIEYREPSYHHAGEMIKAVRDMPAADVRPVVHGKWISVPHKRARVCSHCYCDEPYKFADTEANVYNFCPHCGADMRKGLDDGQI